MYCRMCGKLLDDTDRHCRYCGTVTGFQEAPAEAKTPIEEEVVFNPPFESDERQNNFQLEEEEPQPAEKPEETLKEFISENEIEEQKKQEDVEPSNVRGGEFTWNVHEFPKTKKTDDIEFNWEMREYGPQEQKAVDTAVFEEELFQEIRDEANQIKESNIDRFFTFSKKNEEFQELLDKEYEKFNRRPEPIAKDKPEQIIEAVAAQEDLQIVEETPVPQVEIAEIISEEEIPKAEKNIPQMVIADNVEIIRETEIPKEIESIPEETENKSEDKTAETIAATPKAEHLEEMSQARALFFGADLIHDNESIKKKLEGSEAIEEMAPVQESVTEEPIEKASPETIQAESVPEESAEINEDEKPDKTSRFYEHSVRHEKKASSLTESGKTTEDYVKEEEIKHNAMNPEQSEAETTENGKTNDVTTESEGLETKVTEPLHAFNYTEMEEEQVDVKELKRNRIGMTVLIIIGVILVLEVSILGIRYFAPKSGAAEALETTQTGVLDTITGWFDSISDKISGNDSNDEVKQEESNTEQPKEDTSTTEQQPSVTENESTPSPEKAPMADKAALVATQLANNANIQQVKANDTLTYQEGRDYGLADINQSKPITNNIWMTPQQGADPVYYDQSIVGTVIAFDSQWIDYVSGSSKSILELLKKDSKAYKNTVSYPKIGKVQETFKLLEIGEIRQGSQGFYVWVHEEIQLTEKGKTSERKYNWIYYLEPVDGKMNIVNYFKF